MIIKWSKLSYSRNQNKLLALLSPASAKNILFIKLSIMLGMPVGWIEAWLTTLVPVTRFLLKDLHSHLNNRQNALSCPHDYIIVRN